MNSLRRLGLRVLPPIAVDAARRLRDARSGPPEWEYAAAGWPVTPSHDGGWNDPSVAETQEAKWHHFRRCTETMGPLGIAHEATTIMHENLGVHNDVMAFGYVLGRTARLKDRISILDWGGGLGHFYLFARALFPEVEIEYHCKDVPALVDAGRRLLPDTQFYDSEDEALARDYDLVMASNSLQYSRDWDRVLAGLAGAAREYLYVTNLPLVRDVPSFVVTQRPHRYGYNTEYVCWFINEDMFQRIVRASGMVQQREFLTGTDVRVPNAPAAVQYRGFLFAPGSSAAGTPT